MPLSKDKHSSSALGSCYGLNEGGEIKSQETGRAQAIATTPAGWQAAAPSPRPPGLGRIPPHRAAQPALPIRRYLGLNSEKRRQDFRLPAYQLSKASS